MSDSGALPTGAMSAHAAPPSAGAVGNLSAAGRALERRREDAAAPQGDLRAAAILESALDCIVMVDHEGRIAEFNPAAERTFGYRRDGVVGEQLADVIIPPALREQHRRGFARHLATGEARVLGKRVEMTAMRSDGREFPVELTITSIRLDGRPFFIAYLRDLTERRRIEEEQAKQARQSALRAEVSGVLARTGPLRGMLQGCTEALVRHLDVAFARIWTLARGSAVLELQASAGLYTHLDGPHSRVAVGHLKIGLIAQERTPHLTNDVLGDPRVSDKEWAKRERMVAFAGYPLVVDDRVVGVMAIFSRRPLEADTLDALGSVADSIGQGIDRKRSEEQLRRSEAYLAEGQRLSRTGSWAWNPATGRMFWSREMLRIYGFDPAESPPPYDALRSRIHPADLPAADRATEEALRDVREFDTGYRVLRPDGSITHIRQVGHPVLDGSGRLVEFIGTVVDVTERRRAERRLRRAIRARYEAVLEERARIARDMHDGLLQNVAGIALQLGALLPHVQTAPDAATERLKQILELSERTGREARQALVGMRARGGSTDLVAAVGQAAQSVAVQSELTFSFNVQGRARSIRADVCDVAVSIVQEAMTNVLKHAHARGVKLSVKFGTRSVCLSVRDDGQGLIPHEGEVTDAGHFGLVGMRERATSVGARFAVRSAPGRGTVVRLDAPYRG